MGRLTGAAGESVRPLISIGIPNFNYDRFVGQCIESAMAQSGVDVEILISDNGSTDSSWRTISSFKDDRIRAWRQPTNIGMFANWNFLLRRARGAYFKLLQSDDLVTDRFVRSFRDLIASASPVALPAVIVHGFHSVGAAGEVTGGHKPSATGLPCGIVANDRSVAMLHRLSEFGQPTLNVLRTDLALAANGYVPESSMRADYLLLLKILASRDAGHVGITDDLLGVQRFHGSNERTRYSAIASIRDELVATRIVEGAVGMCERGAVRAWKDKVAAHAVLHCVYSILRGRAVEEARGMLNELRNDNLLVRGVSYAPLYALLFGVLKLLPTTETGLVGNLRRFLRQ